MQQMRLCKHEQIHSVLPRDQKSSRMQCELSLSYFFSFTYTHCFLPSRLTQHMCPFYMLPFNPGHLSLWNQQQNQLMLFVNWRVQIFNYNSIQQNEMKSSIIIEPVFLLLLSLFFLYFCFSSLILSFFPFEVTKPMSVV